MHLDEGLLQAVLDGEAQATAHLETCVECRKRLEALREGEQVVNHALTALDHPTPTISVETVLERARRSPPPPRLLRWAAVFALLLLGAGALYAIPGSPLRRWIGGLVTHPRAPANTAEHPAGVALVPGDRFRVVFSAVSRGSVAISLTDRTTVDVRCISGTARFSAEIDGVRVETDSTAADFVIDIPRSAPRVEVLAGERRIFLKDGPRTIPAIPAVLPLR